MRRSRAFTVAGNPDPCAGCRRHTAVFSVSTAVLSALNYPDPDRIVQSFFSSSSGPARVASIPDLRFFAGLRQSAGDICVDSPIGDGPDLGAPEQVPEFTSHQLLPTSSGAPPLVLCVRSTKMRHCPWSNVVVLSYRLWKRRSGDDKSLARKSRSKGVVPSLVWRELSPEPKCNWDSISLQFE